MIAASDALRVILRREILRLRTGRENFERFLEPLGFIISLPIRTKMQLCLARHPGDTNALINPPSVNPASSRMGKNAVLWTHFV